MSSRATKSVLRLVLEVWTIISRLTASRAPSMATLRACPGAWMRRSAPRLAQAWARLRMGERLGLINEEKIDVAGRGLGLAQLKPQADARHAIAILPALQAVAGAAPAEPPFSRRRMPSRDVEIG